MAWWRSQGSTQWVWNCKPQEPQHHAVLHDSIQYCMEYHTGYTGLLKALLCTFCRQERIALHLVQPQEYLLCHLCRNKITAMYLLQTQKHCSVPCVGKGARAGGPLVAVPQGTPRTPPPSTQKPSVPLHPASPSTAAGGGPPPLSLRRSPRES